MAIFSLHIYRICCICGVRRKSNTITTATNLLKPMSVENKQRRRRERGKTRTQWRKLKCRKGLLSSGRGKRNRFWIHIRIRKMILAWIILWYTAAVKRHGLIKEVNSDESCCWINKGKIDVKVQGGRVSDDGDREDTAEDYERWYCIGSISMQHQRARPDERRGTTEDKQVWSTNRCVLSTVFSTFNMDRRTD